MKILLINTLSGREQGSGAEEIAWEQVKALQSAGHQCMLLTTAPQGSRDPVDYRNTKLWRARLRNVYWPFDGTRRGVLPRLLWHGLDMYNPFMQASVRQVVAREQPDIALVHNLAGFSVAVWRTLAQLGVPTVQVLHDTYAICVKSTMYRAGQNCQKQCLRCRVFRLPHRRLSRHIGAVVGVSQYVLDRHVACGYFKNVPVRTVIHNARNPRSFFAKRAMGEAQRACLRLGYIGKLDPTKGVDRLIQAYRAADLPDTELRIAGTGNEPYTALLHEQARGLPVRFLGYQEAHDFYKQLDVLIVPSLWNDTLPTVVLESMMSGVPVVASVRGGIPEIVKDGENGLLFDPDDVNDLVRCLRRVCTDDALRQHLTHNARKSMAAYSDISRWCERYERLCQALLQN